MRGVLCGFCLLILLKNKSKVQWWGLCLKNWPHIDMFSSPTIRFRPCKIILGTGTLIYVVLEKSFKLVYKLQRWAENVRIRLCLHPTSENVIHVFHVFLSERIIFYISIVSTSPFAVRSVHQKTVINHTDVSSDSGRIMFKSMVPVSETGMKTGGKCSLCK